MLPRAILSSSLGVDLYQHSSFIYGSLYKLALQLVPALRMGYRCCINILPRTTREPPLDCSAAEGNTSNTPAFSITLKWHNHSCWTSIMVSCLHHLVAVILQLGSARDCSTSQIRHTRAARPFAM
jgi:hypothetical protein